VDKYFLENFYQVREGMLIQKLLKTGQVADLQEIQGCNFFVVCNADESSLFFNLQ
jgi:hypothetical protein